MSKLYIFTALALTVTASKSSSITGFFDYGYNCFSYSASVKEWKANFATDVSENKKADKGYENSFDISLDSSVACGVNTLGDVEVTWTPGSGDATSDTGFLTLPYTLDGTICGSSSDSMETPVVGSGTSTGTWSYTFDDTTNCGAFVAISN